MPRQPAPRPILALETATTCGSVALVESGKVLAEYSLDIPTTHSRRVFNQVETVMKDVGAAWSDLAGVAISLGPGSFTGLRIGLSLAKGLVLAHNLPFLGVSTLDGLARQVVCLPTTKVCALLDARKQEVYAALYECGVNGLPVRTGEDLVLPPEKLAEKLSGPILLVGDGALTYREVFSDKLGASALFTPASSHFPRAATIGILAEEKLTLNILLDPVDSVPIYVRPSEAEINLRKKA
ncbi:MAG TPA: tRNA (adenosine(37)-N6)-threonylcarbamoyltransferase complex dimerization subunit type 1 TsaB [Pseudodesulfovibrio sp.]|nr:tRNA (adenosine(37)-N6)-threonylcarbamoyltransferase complex dimerization subunit type 1 TsaB [Pseudodesulfovibrio sp.]